VEGDRRRPLARVDAIRISAMVDQRLLMYIVISMPKRKSTASGVSHFIRYLLWMGGWIIPESD
jgi:hypothetical protein